MRALIQTPIRILAVIGFCVASFGLWFMDTTRPLMVWMKEDFRRQM